MHLGLTEYLHGRKEAHVRSLEEYLPVSLLWRREPRGRTLSLIISIINKGIGFFVKLGGVSELVRRGVMSMASPSALQGDLLGLPHETSGIVPTGAQ